jgi:hypothetical protein
LPDSTVISKQCNRTLIESKFEEGEIPKYLHIKGWSFDLEIARDTLEQARLEGALAWHSFTV